MGTEHACHAGAVRWQGKRAQCARAVYKNETSRKLTLCKRTFNTTSKTTSTLTRANQFCTRSDGLDMAAKFAHLSN